MERPSFQFYPEAWLADIALRACSSAARGLWIDMLCLMHQGSPYGYLKLRDSNGGYFQPDVPTLAKMTGNTPEEVTAWIAELDSVGALGRTRSGTIYSKKMVRDERVRKQWRNRQARSRSKSCHDSAANLQAATENPPKPLKQKEKNKRDVTGGVTPMSRGSPSSSPSSEDPKKRDSHDPERSSQDGRSKGGTSASRRAQRKAPPANPYPFTIYWNRKEQRLQCDDLDVIVRHFSEWAAANGKNDLPIRSILREAQPSFERHAIKEGYEGVSPNRLTLMFGKWVERDILRFRGRSNNKPDAFQEALREIQEEDGAEKPSGD